MIMTSAPVIAPGEWWVLGIQAAALDLALEAGPEESHPVALTTEPEEARHALSTDRRRAS
jgi:hypothetical protein